MPILNLKTNQPLSNQQKNELAKLLTEVTAKTLNKDPEVSVVNITSSSNSNWFTNATSEEQPICQLTISITKNTNNTVQKENWLQHAWSILHQVLGVSDKTINYLSINEIEGNNWGYNGTPQHTRLAKK